jgi:hypothetical protein
MNGKTEIINLTAQTVDIEYEGVKISFPPSGTVCRIETKTVVKETINGIPTVMIEYGYVENLPQPQDGITFIVSILVGQRYGGAIRNDLIGPNTNDAVRGPTGTIVSVPGFVRY